MTIPNVSRAVVAAEKLTGYLLNPDHKRGGPKARLLLSLGYRTESPEMLEVDRRTQHLSQEPSRRSQNPYGVVYEIEPQSRLRVEQSCDSAQFGRSTLE